MRLAVLVPLLLLPLFSSRAAVLVQLLIEVQQPQTAPPASLEAAVSNTVQAVGYTLDAPVQTTDTTQVVHQQTADPKVGAMLVLADDCTALERRFCVVVSGDACECIPGYYNGTAADNCVPCPAGSFKADYGSWPACTPCPQGWISPLEGQTQCWRCPDNTTSVDGGLRCAQCSAGSFFFYHAEDSGCLPCPNGTFSAAAGGVLCYPCPPGFRSSEDRTECVACPGGTVVAPSGCVPCPAGSYEADMGSGPDCVPCAAGTYAPMDGLQACIACPPYSTSGGVGARSCACLPGTVSDFFGSRGCVPCPAGSYYDTAQNACPLCPAGHFSGSEAATACSACPDGLKAVFPGATACSNCSSQVGGNCGCPAGQYNRSGACTPCSPRPSSQHYISADCAADRDAQYAPCTPACAAGAYMSANCSLRLDAVCTPCAAACPSAGYYIAQECSPYADTVCAPCSARCPGNDSYVQAPCAERSDIVCAPCPEGTLSSLSGNCTRCPPGQYLLYSCAACPAGTFSNPNRTACVERCGEGAFAATAVSCELCPPGSWPDADGLCVGAAQVCSLAGFKA